MQLASSCRCGRPNECIVPICTSSGEYLTTYQGCNACYIVFRRLLEVNLRTREVRTAGKA